MLDTLASTPPHTEPPTTSRQDATPPVKTKHDPDCRDLNHRTPISQHQEEAKNSMPPSPESDSRPANAPLKVGPTEYKPYIDTHWPFPTEESRALAPFHMHLYSEVRATGLPNYMGTRRKIPSQLNCEKWDELLEEYEDRQICDFIKYGWPVSFTAPSLPISTPANHASALRHPEAIKRFIDKELHMQALLGPFPEDPFQPWTKVSPLMTRDKKEGSGKRVILDLSFPPGRSVNDGIIKNFFQGDDFFYTLPTPLDLADHILKAGRGAYLWKADLQRAYRQLRIDPLDYPLLAIRHNNMTYIDVCPSFGCRCSGGFQQRVSNAVVYLMSQKHHTSVAYVDDFAGVAPSFQEALQSFSDFEQLTEDLGLKLAAEKTTFPTTSLEFLGLWFDTQKLTITIPEARLEEVTTEAERWTNRSKASKQEVQSLAGKLNFIAMCVRPARKFMGRILAALRTADQNDTVEVSEDFKKDLIWFVRYAKACNRRLMLEPKERHEALNIVQALKTLIPPDTRQARILVQTDNIAAMYSLNTGKTQDPILAACAREIWLISALQELDILITHTPGVELVLADALSRRSFNSTLSSLADSLVTKGGLTRAKPVPFNELITFHLQITDILNSQLYQQMITSYGAAFSQGTIQNRIRQARTYLMFMIAHNLDYLDPSPLHIALYTQFLANSFKTTATIKNYLSGARTYVGNSGRDTATFSSPLLHNLIRGLAKLSTHIPIQAPAISLLDLKRLCDILSVMDHDAQTARTAILFAFASLLRQSNLLPSPGPGQVHTIRRADVIDGGSVIWVNINSSKTIIDPQQRVSIPIPYIGSRYCPVLAWRSYLRRMTLTPDQPAFMLSPTSPLTPQRLNAYIRAALGALGLPNAHLFTVHSLRRSGAQECAKRGASQAHLMTHGTWASQAINSYFPKRLYTSIPHYIHNMFGHHK